MDNRTSPSCSASAVATAGSAAIHGPVTLGCGGAPNEGLAPENHLLQARLGVASSLFVALRLRHSPTAAHSLRVTLGCASWALALGMSEEQRNVIEVAALLHDIGKISMPDSVLLKPGPLTSDELALLESRRLNGVAILRSSCTCQALLDIVQYATSWYDGNRSSGPLAGADLPLGARMLAIVDAFDSMTSDQPYRRAMSRERAFTELFRHAGTQFDPELVKVFAALNECDQSRLHEQVAQRWLAVLDQPQVNSLWQLNPAGAGAAPPALDLFPQTLLDNIRDTVVFIDSGLRVTLWNAGAERMTGIAADSIQEHRFEPALLEMRSDDGVTIENSECLVAEAIQTGEQRLQRLIIRGRGRKDVTVEAHVVPVVGGDGIAHGATLVLHDVSPELSLEARCHSLRELATKDPLTRVANRAEFNRVHAMFVAAHLERELPCSLIIADLDHFKQVNDTFGHQAGDEVLKTFAKVLNGSCRPGDLVARYGGEEFVVLCADCDNAGAFRRAEEIRRRICQVQHPCLDQRRVSSSFGVTEVQHGDTPETMVARADRALYDAKARGRNTVVQLGAGLGQDGAEAAAIAESPRRAHMLAEQELVTSVPMAVAIEKLRGFVADQNAEILAIDQGEVRLQVGHGWDFTFRRLGDRNVPLIVSLRFSEDKRPALGGPVDRSPVRTRIRLEIRPKRNRDRRREQAITRSRQLVASLRAYLMASEDSEYEGPAPPSDDADRSNLPR